MIKVLMHQFAMHLILAIHLLAVQKLVSKIIDNLFLICVKEKERQKDQNEVFFNKKKDMTSMIQS